MAKTILILITLCLGLVTSYAQTNFFSSYHLTPFYIIHNSDHGGGIAYYSNTNTVSIGAAFACIYEKNELNFYNTSVSLKLGKTYKLTDNYSLDIYAETGAAINLKQVNTLYEQSIVGCRLSRQFANKHKFFLGFGIGNNSKWGTDTFYIISASYNFK